MIGRAPVESPSEWRRMKHVIPGFCPVHFSFRSQGDQLKTHGKGRLVCVQLRNSGQICGCLVLSDSRRKGWGFFLLLLSLK
jgi:hypothetical protein